MRMVIPQIVVRNPLRIRKKTFQMCHSHQMNLTVKTLNNYLLYVVLDTSKLKKLTYNTIDDRSKDRVRN